MPTNGFYRVIRRGLLVSFKNKRSRKAYDAESIGKLLQAVEAGGAVALRTGDIGIVRRASSLVDIPVMVCIESENCMGLARNAVAEGADVVALARCFRSVEDADRSLPDLVQSIKSELGVPVSLDVSSFQEARRALQAGADALVLTNAALGRDGELDGHGALLALLSEVNKSECRAVPVLVDGYFWDRDEIKRAVLAGAHAVLVDESALDPLSLTRYYTAVAQEAMRVAVRIGDIDEARRHESDLSRLVSEQRNPDTMEIDRLPSLEILKLINREDRKVAPLLEKLLPEISKAVDTVVDCFRKGGRLVYAGAGTSGRLGIADAAECPPTFGVSPRMVHGLIAGGDTAIRTPVEGAEDSKALGRADIASQGIGPNDVLIGICSSGRTPYVIGALEEARKRKAETIAIANNPGSRIGKVAELKIEAVTGPEVVLGSTRMKAGTSAKLILNMISTTAMIRIGKVYSNLMIDLDPCNTKLLNRAVRLIEQAADVSREAASKLLEASGLEPKVAVVMAATGVDSRNAREAIETADGLVTRAIEIVRNSQSQ